MMLCLFLLDSIKWGDFIIQLMRFRLFLKRKLSNLKWMAIEFLAVGTTTSQVKGCGEASCDSIFSSLIRRYMLDVMPACLSVMARVYTEFLMKMNNDTLYNILAKCLAL
ncbi:putative nucleotide-sugar transporter [Helianthus anomalus]